MIERSYFMTFKTEEVDGKGGAGSVFSSLKSWFPRCWYVYSEMENEAKELAKHQPIIVTSFQRAK